MLEREGGEKPSLSPELPNIEPEEHKHCDFSPGFPKHIPGPLMEIYISDLIQLS